MAEVAGDHIQYLAFHHMFDPDNSSQPVLRGELYRNDPDAAWLVGVNEYDGHRYFVKEPFERLAWWMSLPALLTLAAEKSPSEDAVRRVEREIAERLRAAEDAGYRMPRPGTTRTS